MLAAACIRKKYGGRRGADEYERVSHRLHSIVAAIDEQLDISSGQAIDALQIALVQPPHGEDLETLTSSALSGVGAPGPPTPASSNCSSSALMTGEPTSDKIR
jgi:hypothetical protein